MRSAYPPYSATETWMRSAYPYGDPVSGMPELSFELDPLDSRGRDAPPILRVPSPCD